MIQGNIHRRLADYKESVNRDDDEQIDWRALALAQAPRRPLPLLDWKSVV